MKGKNKIVTRKYSVSNKAGFSLIEVLVTLVILTLGIVAISIMMVGNIKNAETAKNQIISAQLAQEGLELMRNLKDNKVASLDNMAVGNYTGYRIDKTLSLDNNADKRLYLNGNFYTHTAGTYTKFFRTISISVSGDKTLNPSTRVITVTATVSWNNSSIPAACTVANKCVSAVSIMPDID